MSENLYHKIRYRGRLKNPTDLPQLIHETEDICRSQGWPHHIWDEDWAQPSSITLTMEDGAMKFEGHAPLKGISFTIGTSETVWLTFMPDGTLQSLFTLTDPTFTANDADFPWQRVKTSHDDPLNFLAICKLFRYLARRYFDPFEVREESGYWQHGDDDKLIAWMDDFSLRHQQMEEELAAIMADDSLTAEEKRERTYGVIKGVWGGA